MMLSAHRVFTIGCAIFTVALISSATAQATRDQASIAPGTGAISGVVVSDDTTARPIARAVVTLRSPELQPHLQLVTDEDGRFTFSALPRGSFVVTASKAGYLTLSYGQTVVGRGSGLPIALEAGQRIADIRLVLPRGSVISGRVIDDASQPVSNAPIVILQYRTVNGERTLSSMAGSWPNTDSRGMYRAFGLPPGDYIVCAYPSGDYLAIPQDCNPGGGASGVRQVTAADVQWARQQIQSAEGRGGVPAGSVPPPPPALSQTMAFGPVFYPSATRAASAEPITLGRAEERAGIDLVMSRQPTARISATIIGVDGQVATGASVRFSDGFGTAGMVAPDGRYAANDLRPGQYTLTAFSGSAYATMDISVNGRDIPDLVLRLQPAGATTVTLSGRTAFDAATLTPPASLTGVRVSLVGAKPTGLLSATARADGTFTIQGIDPGRYRIQASLAGQPPAGSGPAWQVKSAMVNGKDASDMFIDLELGQDLSDVVVTFTDHPGELSGTLQYAAGKPAPGYYVVVFSADRSFWRQGARRLPAPVRVATDGTFRFPNLPAGAYHLVALTDVNQSDLYDEAFLTHLAASALSITLADGEKKTQNLTVGPGR
jgi:hypothetical protein